MNGRRNRGVALLCLILVGWATPLPSAAQDGGPAETDGGLVGDAGDAGASDAGPRRRPTRRPIPTDRLPEVEARLGAEQVELGAVIPMTITIKTRPGDRVHLRKSRRFGDFELLDRNRREGAADSADGNSDAEILELELISFEVGQLEIPPIELMVVLGDGRTGNVSTEPLSIRVTDPLGNEPDPQPRADHPPRPVHTTDRRALWVGSILGGLLLALLLGMAIGRLRRRRLGPPPGPPPPPPRPPEEVAFEKLEAAERSDWLETGEIKKFHIAVSEAIREYFGGRYGFDSLELTTEELVRQLEQVVVRGVSREELQLFLRDTDMVKFAKWRPDVERSKSLLTRAYDIVRRTTQAEQLAVPRIHGGKTDKTDKQPGGDDVAES